MATITWPGNNQWPLPQKIAFRFIFIYFILYMAPWQWVYLIPGAETLSGWFDTMENAVIQAANKNLFHGYQTLVSPNGSGDTSYNFTQVWLYLVLAAIACGVWSLVDRKRLQYNRLAYWLRLLVRYFLIINCFGYGIIKLFALQMPFPNQSQLATPLGDLLPMRLSWMFMGYSAKYQAFSGAMEVLAGLLLLFRRSATAGTLLAAGVFCNVMVMNLCYDIPVKLFSTHLFLMCLLLLAFEYRRILNLLLNKALVPGNLFLVSFSKKWMRISRIVVKCLFILAVVVLPFISSQKRYRQLHNTEAIKPIRPGMYDVAVFARGRDTLAPLITDTVRWQNVIFEKGGSGSVKTSDTIFRQWYKRGYFVYSTDTAQQEMIFKKRTVQGETFDLFRLQYQLPDSNTIVLKGLMRSDSVYAVLKKSNRHFQLAEKQFHWLSEYNR
jgi:hypothetical protein